MATNSTLDDRFGPIISQYLDFTQLFEDTILSLLPSLLFLCAFPIRARWLWGKPRKVTGGLLHTNKLVIISMFAATQVVCLGFWAAPSTPKSTAAVAAAAFTVLDAVALGILSHLEHLRSIRPSIIINLYILITMPMDAARARTLWIRGDNYELATAFTSTVSIKLVVLIAEAFEKRDILLSQYRDISPEATSGIYSRSFFWWLTPLLRNGFRKVLADEDLYPVNQNMRSEVVELRLKREWAKQKNKLKKHALVWRALWAVRGPLAKAVFPRLCVTAFQYVQPFLITAVVNFLTEPAETQLPSLGWLLTAAYGLDYFGLAIAQGAFMHETYRTVTIVRGTLVMAIYSQTVDLRLTSVDESAALTLMATDVEKICDAFAVIHGLWSSVVEITLGVYLLQRQIGLASLGPVALTVVSSGMAIWMSRYTSKAQVEWVQRVQTRINATTRIITGMKAVKMLGLTDVMGNLLAKLREDEINHSMLYRKLNVLRILFGKGSELLAPGVAFAAFTIISNATGQPLNVATAYSSLTIVNLLMTPLGQTIQALTVFSAAFGCFDRIQAFLNLPAQRDHRLESGRSLASPKLASPRSHLDGIELHELRAGSDRDSNLMVKVQDASFSWKDTDPVIRNVTFDIPESGFTVFVGPVGSGKSTLLKGLIGETPSTSGFVYTKEMRVGFVDQTCWIQNGTFQSNILGISVYERDWYSTVIHACALQEDINILPRGDQTRVGSAGISLSGGQKQRLALARAIYARKRLVILDDSFSGLDASSEDKIFNRLLGKNGLMRKLGVTVILATHAVHRLPFADHIIALTANGRIAEQGTFKYLMERGSYVSTLTSKRRIEDEKVTDGELAPAVESFKNPAEDREIDRAAEEASRQAGDWATYSYYLRATGLFYLGIFIASMIGFAVFWKIDDLWITFWAAGVSAHGNSVNGYYLGVYWIFQVLSFISLFVTAASNMLLMTPRSAIRLHKTVLETVMNAPLLFFTSTDTGITVNRFSQDMSLIDMELPSAFVELVADAAFLITEAVLMCLSAGYFAASMPFVMVLLYFLQQFYLRTSRQLRLLDLEAKSPLYSHFMETLEGLVTVRAFGWSKDFESTNARLLDTSQKPFYLLFCIQRWLALVLDLTVAALTVVLMIIVVKLRATINPGFVALALSNVNAFSLSLTELIKSWTRVETSIGSVTRVKSFEKDTPCENLAVEHESIPSGSSWPSKGVIELKNLSAYYKPGTLVLKNLSLNIAAGQRVGICGSSGSGKSTIVAALFRMLEISSGTISIDGLDLAHIPRQDVRSRINAIPQEAYFFKGSIRTNIDPAGRCFDSELKEALESVTLWSIVEEHGGLDAPANIEMFSHGQRQLFCLARAILHPSKIVILDEATASVDLETDDLMQRIIRKVFKDCTILAVAHRLDTVMDFDRIAVVKAGELIEYDTPKALMARDSAFKALYESH